MYTALMNTVHTMYMYIVCIHCSYTCTVCLFIFLDGDEFLMKNISLQLSCWATPGFMRGFVSNNSVGGAFCSEKWMKLVMKLLENSIQTTGPKPSWALNSEQQVRLCTTCSCIVYIMLHVCNYHNDTQPQHVCLSVKTMEILRILVGMASTILQFSDSFLLYNYVTYICRHTCTCTCTLFYFGKVWPIFIKTMYLYAYMIHVYVLYSMALQLTHAIFYTGVVSTIPESSPPLVGGR